MTSFRTSFRTALAPALAVATLLALPAAAHATSAPAATAAAGACTDPTGVTVVVDLTDLGGDVEVGCAETAATGTEALAAAGFTETRDAAGMICAINALPDPCPATFEGAYWSYWYAEQGGEWQTYMEGSDTAVPAPGSVEGWRYSDGSQGPSLAAPVVAEAPVAEETVEPEPTTSAEESAEEADATATVTPADEDPAQPGPSPALLGGLGLLGALAVAAVLVARRRSASGHGPAGQD